MAKFIQVFKRHPTIVVGGFLLSLLFLMAIFAPWLGTIDPTALSPIHRTRVPSERFWFGTDLLGRDVYSRVVYGARVSLTVGFSVAILSAVIGTVIGLAAGFVKWIDAIVMRIMDGFMSIPTILLAIALIALTRASLQNVILAVTIAALTVQTTYICGLAILAEASLSFIGAGVPPSTPSWGNIMAEGRALWQIKPHLIAFPALFLSITILSINMLGDGLRDAIDPRMAKRI